MSESIARYDWNNLTPAEKLVQQTAVFTCNWAAQFEPRMFVTAVKLANRILYWKRKAGYWQRKAERLERQRRRELHA